MATISSISKQSPVQRARARLGKKPEATQSAKFAQQAYDEANQRAAQSQIDPSKHLSAMQRQHDLALGQANQRVNLTQGGRANTAARVATQKELGLKSQLQNEAQQQALALQVEQQNIANRMQQLQQAHQALMSQSQLAGNQEMSAQQAALQAKLQREMMELQQYYTELNRPGLGEQLLGLGGQILGGGLSAITGGLGTGFGATIGQNMFGGGQQQQPTRASFRNQTTQSVPLKGYRR